MPNQYSIDNILTPLALTVIIDNVVRDPELSEFVVQAEGLLDLLEHEHGMNSGEIINWFHDNEATLLKRMKSARKNTYVLTILNQFKDDDMVIEAMYDAMLAISISDKEYHVDESDLIKSAASLWGYERPPFKVIGKQ
ncbi:MAG: hypothetical protein L3J65_09320 [Robiginitomaculum sp.]|nr:hypothetical protein [Robiginitomaculum sp.]